MKPAANREETMRYLASALGIACAIACVVGAQGANVCRTSFEQPSIANLKDNGTAGGHIYKHIVGQPTEADKSLWPGRNSDESWKSFKAAFAKWQTITKYPTVAQCGLDGSVTDCVPIQYFGDVVPNRYQRCTAVDKNGNCTKTTQQVTRAVVAWVVSLMVV
jgi:hypothetical protein